MSRENDPNTPLNTGQYGEDNTELKKDSQDFVKKLPTKRGRPTEFKPEYITLAEKIYKIGATDLEFAEILSVNVDSIYSWKNKFPEFAEAIKRGKAYYDSVDVENSLKKRASGFMRRVERVSKTGEIIQCLEEVPPDTGACIFWLKNRQSDRWKDKQDLEHSGTLTVMPALAIKKIDGPKD